MRFSHTKESLILFFGDLIILLVSLFVTLLLRYGGLSERIIDLHILPFTILFAVWVVVFYIAGLYEKSAVVLRSKLPGIILRTQIINSALAVIFFYFIPYFLITPKTNLFIYLAVSFILILTWRVKLQSFIGTRRKYKALLIGSGEEMKELKEEVEKHPSYNISFSSSIDLDEIEGLDFREDVSNRVYSDNINLIVVDLQNEKVAPYLPHLYNLVFSKIRFIEMHKIYEDIFSRIPLSLVRYSWFLENISHSSSQMYDGLKRLMDIFIALILGLISLIFYPFIFLAIKLEDKGKIFFVQERIGKNNRIIKIYKFRSLSVDNGDKTNITKVGKFLRKTRIDELPQLWNVLRGELSLIGPRPEMPELVKKYETEISYYNVRHLIKPGLSGWAQIYLDAPPKWRGDNHSTKKKLSYDLFYIKNRSLILDLKIALKTIKVLLSRKGV